MDTPLSNSSPKPRFAGVPIDLARVKRNVAKMAAQNAPEEDIDGYIASEGTTVDAIRDFKPFSAPKPRFPGMPVSDGVTLNIGDRKVTVDKSFLGLSPEDQNSTVEEIARNLGLSGRAEPHGVP